MLKILEWVAGLSVVALVVAVIGIAYLSSAPPGNRGAQHATVQQENRDQGQERSSLQGLVHFLFPDGVAVFTLALVVATIGLWWMAIDQIGFLRRSEIISSEASKAAKESADAAKKSAEIAQDSLVKIQRAFLSINQMRYLSHTDNEGKVWWSFHIDWQNSGVTPALRAKFFTAKYLEDIDMPADFKFSMSAERPEIFVGPRSSIGAGNIGVNAEDLIAVRERKKFLYFWGRVDYRDIFDTTPDHVTKFLIQILDFRGDVTKEWNPQTNIVEIITTNPNRHNCADESCQPD